MNTTILLSTQRSGTTFFDRKICGMYGFPMQGGEMLSHKKFKMHNSDHLLGKHSQCNMRGADNIKTLWSDNDYFVKIKPDLLPKIVSNSDWPMFNIQYNFILNQPKYVKNVDTPIIHLIRRDSWRRSISEYVMRNTDQSPHIIKSKDQIQRIITIDKNELIRESNNRSKQVIHFRDKLKDKSNVMTLYYEDISREEYWTDDFIGKLESFMGQKFTNKEYHPPNMKVSNFVTITNEEEIIDKELIRKYYIEKI